MAVKKVGTSFLSPTSRWGGQSSINQTAVGVLFSEFIKAHLLFAKSLKKIETSTVFERLAVYRPLHSIYDFRGEVLIPPAVQEEAEFIHLQQVTKGRLLQNP